MQCDIYDVSCMFFWLMEEIKLMFVFCVDAIFSAFASLVELIPVPDFLVTGTLPLPSGVLYFADLLRLQYGLTVVVSAYVARFILRRIPGIG